MLQNAVAMLPTSLLAFLVTYASAQEVDGSVNQEQICDAKCHRDVKIMEALIVAVVLVAALMVIFFCMHCIDTPTRFSTPKDQRSHQD